MIEKDPTDECSAGEGALHQRDLHAAAGFEIVRDGARHPGVPGDDQRAREKPPEDQQRGGDGLHVSKGDQGERDDRGDHGKADQDRIGSPAQDTPDQGQTRQPAKAEAEQRE